MVQSKKNYAILILIYLSFLPSCYRYKHPIDAEKLSVHENAKKHLGMNVELDKFDEVTTEEVLAAGISRAQAVLLAVKVDPTLQILLKDLGIAKADLIQAGFISNPHADFWIQPLSECQLATYALANFSMNISDFWQIPYRKHVANDDVELSMIAAHQQIINLRADTEELYDKTLFVLHQQEATKTLLNELKAFKAHATHRKSKKKDLNKRHCVEIMRLPISIPL